MCYHPGSMSDDPNAVIEALHAFFPQRAQAVVAILKRENGKANRIEIWREDQLTKFVATLILTASELERAHNERRISTIAWLTRNLLELSIWIEFCNETTEQAQRFNADATRDLYGISKAVQTLVVLDKGLEDVELRGSQQRLSAFGQSLGIDQLSDDFKRVSDAAEVLGRRKVFLGLNKVLSKFAHPTAWAVNSVLSLEADTGLRNMFFSDGVAMAIDSLNSIRNFILKSYPELNSVIPSGIVPAG